MGDNGAGSSSPHTVGTGVSRNSVCSRNYTDGDHALTLSQRGMVSTNSDLTGQIEVLSVDDEPTNQAVVGAILKGRNYLVTKAFDGVQCLKILEARRLASEQDPNGKIVMPDLILLDVMMPNMNGFECCAKIRERFPLCAVPIIMVSAKSREENVIQGLSCGSNDYVTKPFSKLELLARIDTQLQLRMAWRMELERERSEVLLRQMLPHHIISRLTDPSFAKDKNELIADEHDVVAVLFSDIVGFTALSASKPTIEIIYMLNEM